MAKKTKPTVKAKKVDNLKVDFKEVKAKETIKVNPTTKTPKSITKASETEIVLIVRNMKGTKTLVLKNNKKIDVEQRYLDKHKIKVGSDYSEHL